MRISFHFCRPRRHRTGGFTAIELMVVVAIVAIMAAWAMPSFNDVIARYRVRQATEDLSAMLYLARSESIKRGGGVTLRKASPGGCSTANAGDWSCGWIMFVDANNNGTLDEGELPLQQSPMPGNLNIAVSKANPADSMKFDAWGQVGGLGALSVAFRPVGNSNAALQMHLCMTGGGRLKTLKGSETCS